MNTVQKTFINRLKTGVCAIALIGFLITPSAFTYAENTSSASKVTESKVEESTQKQTAELRKEIMEEAVSALRETHNALKALDDGKYKNALFALEKATGKLEIILTRDPALALAPTNVHAVTHDVWGSIDAIEGIREDAEDLLEDGRVQDARRMLSGLASETVISVNNLPLATYPQAIKAAVKLIDQNKIKEAKHC